MVWKKRIECCTASLNDVKGRLGDEISFHGIRAIITRVDYVRWVVELELDTSYDAPAGVATTDEDEDAWEDDE